MSLKWLDFSLSGHFYTPLPAILTPTPRAGAAAVAPGIVTDPGQLKMDVALLRALQGRGSPVAVFLCRQRRGSGGSPRRGELFAAFDSGHAAGQLTGDQVLDDPYTVQAALEQQQHALGISVWHVSSYACQTRC